LGGAKAKNTLWPRQRKEKVQPTSDREEKKKKEKKKKMQKKKKKKKKRLQRSFETAEKKRGLFSGPGRRGRGGPCPGGGGREGHHNPGILPGGRKESVFEFRQKNNFPRHPVRKGKGGKKSDSLTRETLQVRKTEGREQAYSRRRRLPEKRGARVDLSYGPRGTAFGKKSAHIKRELVFAKNIIFQGGERGSPRGRERRAGRSHFREKKVKRMRKGKKRDQKTCKK